jgi:hypothetical protein
LAVRVGTSIQPAACLVSPPALLVHDTSLLALFKWIFCKLICLEKPTFLKYLSLVLAMTPMG